MDLIESKIRVPGLHQNHLPRPHLIKKITTFADQKLCLISAPAGYGKTKLLSEFALRSNGCVAWLSLDEKDNDQERFIRYLSASLRRALTGMGFTNLNQALSIKSNTTEEFLTYLLNRLSDQKQDIFLVLDQYHVINSADIHKSVEFLIDHKSENLHIFILTRSTPNLPLTRWRGRQQLTEIRSNDLMFSGKEIREFLNGIMEFKLSDREIFKITTTSQGWAVSVYFTALHIQQSTFKQGITSTLRNSKINIMDYIREEVISQLPDETTSLMRQTSILNSISSDLCEALTFNPNSEQILRGLEANNFFVSYTDENHRWFSYHPLVTEFLKQQLLEIEPQNVKALHLRASGWFANNGNLEKAIYHAIEGQDFEMAASYIKIKAFDWIDKGQYAVFISWIDQLPHEFFSKQPLLISIYLLSLAESRQTHRFDANFELATKLKMDPITQAIFDSALAVIEYINGNYDNSITIAEKNLRTLSQKGILSKECALAISSSWLIKSRALLIKNNFRDAEQTSNLALPIHLQNSLYGYAITNFGVKAAIRVLHGKLSQAEEVYNQAASLLDRWATTTNGKQNHNFPIAIYAFAPLSQLYYERNQMKEAEIYALKALDSFQGIQETWEKRKVEAYIILAHIKMASGNHHAASEILEKIFQIENSLSFSPATALQKFSSYVLARKMGLMLRMAKQRPYLHNLIAEWGEEHKLDQLSADEYSAYVWANYQILQGNTVEASRILNRLISQAEQSKLNGNLIHYLALETVSLNQQNKKDKALSTLRKALSLAETEGYQRVFINQGKVMQDLLTQIAKQDGPSSYLSKLVEGIATDSSLALETVTQPNIQRLNNNERQILLLMERNYANKQIAEELHLSINTVKWYSYRIFSALGVKNRHEAITMAKKLGLIRDHNI